MVAADLISAWEPSPAWSANCTSPAAREAYRVETQRKQTQKASHHSGASASQWLKTSRGRKLDERKLWVDSEAHAHVRLENELPVLPSSKVGCPLASNTIRFERSMHVTQAMPHDGGRLYSTATLEANWVEESRDKRYKPDWHSKELRRNKLWDTEHSGAYTMDVQPEYAQRMLPQKLVVKPELKVASSKAPVQLCEIDNCSVVMPYGQDGFGIAPSQDHTPETKRGGHWLGISPVMDGKESVTTTVHGRQQPLEFQQRTPADDPRAKFLGTQPGGTLPSYATQVPDRWRMQATEHLRASERFTKQWRSMYSRDFKDFAALRRSTTAPSPAPPGHDNYNSSMRGIGQAGAAATIHPQRPMSSLA